MRTYWVTNLIESKKNIINLNLAIYQNFVSLVPLLLPAIATFVLIASSRAGSFRPTWQNSDLFARVFTFCFDVQLVNQISGDHVQIMCSRNNLLVRNLRLVTHDNRTVFTVNFRVQPGVFDQLNDPQLGVLLGHTKFFGDRVDLDFLMDLTEHLEHQDSAVFGVVVSVFV